MRGKKAPKRTIEPDPKYGDVRISKFINYLMRRGKKTTARTVLYRCFELIKEKTQKEPLEIFELAMKNISPTVEVKGRRVGGANYQIPTQVKADRRFVLASRWVIEAAQGRKGKPMYQKLAMELIDASNKEGSAIKKREMVHKMAEANRAFAHFAR